MKFRSHQSFTLIAGHRVLEVTQVRTGWKARGV